VAFGLKFYQVNRIKKIFANPLKIFSYAFRLIGRLFIRLPYFDFIDGTKNIDPKNTFGIWFLQKVLGFNKDAYWPMHHSSIITYPLNVLIGVDTNPGYNPGCFIHAVNKIYIGDYTRIAPNVGLMSGNHDFYDLRQQTEGNPIVIGKHCWIGMNAVILPEVVLGDFTIVGAGAIVTKSFPDGHCVIAGNPARLIRLLDKTKCEPYEVEVRYIGYIKKAEFEQFRIENLNL
jgi:acetyltransferase-like isoleucine patch superfamily enzyme